MVPRSEEQQQLQQQQQLRRPPPNPRLLSVQSIVSKASFQSYSSSLFEADDERSTTTDSGRMSPRGSIDRGLPFGRYHGEDTRPTSKKELAGWYMYAFAAETYVICESLARENGVLLSDRTTPCGDSSLNKGKGKGKEGEGQCIVTILGMEINTASFAMYSFSISVLLQALLVVSISCAADHGNYRKRLLLTFAWIGGVCVMCYIFIFKEIYVLGAVLAIISNTSFGASFVLLNSFLPLLVRHHPKVQYAAEATATPDLQEDDFEESQQMHEGSSSVAETSLSGSTAALLPRSDAESEFHEFHPLKRTPTQSELTSLELQLSTEISAKGIGIGYGAALFVQCMSILMLVALGSSTWSQRVVLMFIGSWWTVFTIPAAMWLRPRPGPPLPDNGRKGSAAWVAYVIYAWRNLFRTVMLARRLLDIVLFLGAWFLLSDAIATTSSTAILFAKTTLGMKPWALGMINVISTTTGVLGAFTWSFISRHYKLKPHHTILACIALFEVIPLYGLLGYLPFIQNWGVIGLQQPWEMYPLAAIYGFVLGGLSSYCRSLYGELIPPGSEAAFYALYAITDKGSSVFGPTIGTYEIIPLTDHVIWNVIVSLCRWQMLTQAVGSIIDASGEIRPAFWFLAALVGLPAPLVYFVNVERGKAEGEKLAEVIEGFKSRDDLSRADEGRGMLATYQNENEQTDEREQDEIR